MEEQEHELQNLNSAIAAKVHTAVSWMAIITWAACSFSAGYVMNHHVFFAYL
jgi:hypothetical protein